MADQGPLVRVDTDGRGTLIKMTRRAADEFVRTNGRASIVGVRQEPPEPVSTFTEPAAQAPDIAKMKKPDLVKLAKERSIDATGTADDLRERLSAAETESGEETEDDEAEDEGNESEDSEEE